MRRRRRRAGVPGRRDRRAPSAHGRARLLRRRSPDALRRVRDDDQRVMRVVRRFVRVGAPPTPRACGASRPMPPDIPPDVRVSGPSAAYRLGGAPLLQPDAFGLRDILLPAHAGLPPPGSAARRACAASTGTSSAWPARAGKRSRPASGSWGSRTQTRSLSRASWRERGTSGTRGGVPDPGSRTRSARCASPFPRAPCAKATPRTRAPPPSARPPEAPAKAPSAACARPPSVVERR